MHHTRKKSSCRKAQKFFAQKIEQLSQASPQQDESKQSRKQLINDLDAQVQQQTQQTIEENLKFLQLYGYGKTQQTDEASLRPGLPEVEELLSQKVNPVDISQNVLTQIFPFKLDDFQQQTLKVIIQGKSVVGCAPTGAGKTAIAVGASLRCLMQKKRVIYTTPLKALSNQKFNEFKEIFGEARVGLQTGDVVMNSDAQIVIMTTEIFRNQLYREDMESYMGVVQNVSSVGLVVLDEVHYMGDVDRGTVWEEVVINCPKDIQLLAISATIQNPKDLGAWINRVHGDCETVQTNIRPVPLKFWFAFSHVFFKESNTKRKRFQGPVLEVLRNELKIVPLFNEQETRLSHQLDDKSLDDIEDLQQLAEEALQKLSKKREPPIAQLVYELQQREMLPAIYFVFSRANCDKEAIALSQKGLSFVTPEERAIIYEEIQKLKEENPDSLRDSFVEPMCCGIASHHAGCLPGWKALTESLFQRGLIKIVFATETLAAGINMPARTTVISSLARYRDTEIQRLTNNEVLQMAGRAGRRGYDVEGDAVIVLAKHSSPQFAVNLISRPPEPLESQFKPGYGMVLNLLRNRSMDQAREFVEKSFMNFMCEMGEISGNAMLARKIRDTQCEIDELEEQARRLDQPLELELEEKSKEILKNNHISSRKELKALIEKYNQDRGEIVWEDAQYMQEPFAVQIELRKGGDDAIKSSSLQAVCIKVIFKEEVAEYLRPPNEPRTLMDLLQQDLDNYLVCVGDKQQLYVVPPGSICGLGEELDADEKKRDEIYRKLLELGKSAWKEMKGGMKGYQTDVDVGTIPYADKKTIFNQIELDQERQEELNQVAQKIEELEKQRRELRKNSSKKNKQGGTGKFKQQSREIDLVYQRVVKKKAFINRLRKQASQASPTEENWHEFEAIVSVLKKLELLDDNFKPTSLGMIARDFRGDNELWMAIVLTTPRLAQLQAPQLAAVVAALIAGPMFQYKTDIQTMYTASKEVTEVLQFLQVLQDEVVQVQEQFGLDMPILIDERMCGLVEAWAWGQSWEAIVMGCSLDEGDVARLLMRTIDSLKQILFIKQVWEGVKENCRLALKEMDRAPVSEVYL